MSSISVFSEAKLVVLAIASKYGRPRLIHLSTDDARDLATALFEEADAIDAARENRQPDRQKRGRILKLLENPPKD